MGEAAPMQFNPDDNNLIHGEDQPRYGENIFSGGEYTSISERFIHNIMACNYPDEIIIKVLEQTSVISQDIARDTTNTPAGSSTLPNTISRLNPNANANRLSLHDAMDLVSRARQSFQQEFYNGNSLDIDKLVALIDATDTEYGETPLLKTISELKVYANNARLSASVQYLNDADRIARMLLIHGDSEERKMIA